MFTPDTVETRKILSIFDRNNRERLGLEQADFVYTKLTSENAFFPLSPPKMQGFHLFAAL